MSNGFSAENYKCSEDVIELINVIISVTLESIGPIKFQETFEKLVIYGKNHNIKLSILKSKTDQFKENLIQIINNEGHLDLNFVKLDTSLIKAAKRLSDDFLGRYKSKFGCLTDKIFFDVTVDCKKNGERLEDLLCSLFDSSVNWGRIVGMVTVMKELLITLLDRDLLSLIVEYFSVCSKYYDNNIRVWVQKNNGWAGLVAFEASSEAKIFDDILSIGGLAAVTVGAFVAFRFLFNNI